MLTPPGPTKMILKMQSHAIRNKEHALFVLFVNDIFPRYFQRWKALAIIRALLICPAGILHCCCLC